MIYRWITTFRNYLYDKQVFISQAFPVPVISIGNLTMGGTGKTPHVEYLLRLLKNKKVATLSRGYKRKTKGFVLADKTSNAATLGDEPYQYYADFKGITVAVCEKRAVGITKILEKKPETEVIILDDAFQHRPVRPQLNILITDYNRLFYRDHVLPFGRLRESRFGAKRADVVVVSKCPAELTTQEKKEISANILKYSQKTVPVFFTTYKYGAPVNFGKPEKLQKRIALVSGIANPKPLQDYLISAGYEVVKHFNYPDHYAFKPDDINDWLNLKQAEKDTISFLTTRKDATRLQLNEFEKQLNELPFFYVPVAVEFLEKKEEFEKIILKTVEKQA